MLYTEHGIIISHFIKNDNRIFNFLYGFILLIGINQILLTPCILLHMSFEVAFYVVIIADFILVIASFFLKKITYRKNESVLLTSIACVLIGAQLILTTVSYKSNADDSFYVSLSTVNIDSKAIYMEEPSMGYESDKTLLLVTEQIPSIELQISIFSKVANVNPAVMCHSILPMIIIFISYLAFYYFAKSLMDDKNAKVFLIILSVIFLCTGFSTKFRTGCLLIKPWQGKAIFLNIGIPMILATLIKMDKNVKKRDIILLVFSNLFSIALSSTAIFLIPFSYLAFGILKLIKLKWKDILGLIISLAPVIIYVIIFIIMNQNVEEAFAVPRDEVSIIASLKYYNSYIYLVYYLIATIAIMLIGTKQAKRYFVYVQFINLLTIWNPLFSSIIAKYFTSSAIFWRVLWLLPIEFAISYAIVMILRTIKNNKIKLLILIISLGMLLIPGKFAYKFEFAENLENIPQYIVNQTNYILDKGKNDDEIIVLALPEPWHNTTMRQISSKIKLIYSRDLYIEKIKNKEDIEQRINLNKLYYENYEYTVEEFNEVLKEQKIDWIIVNNENTNLINYINESIFSKDCEVDGYTLYRNIGNI